MFNGEGSMSISDCKVKTDIGGQAKHGLEESNGKTRKYLLGGCW